MVRVAYTCLDGTPFPVEFARAEDARTAWLIDREHAPRAMTPLADGVRPVGQPGELQAYRDCGVTAPAILGEVRPRANGYAYHRAFDLTPDEWAQLGSELLSLSRRHGGSLGVWEEHVLPEVRRSCERLEAAPAGTPFAELAVERELAWGLTSVAGLVARIDEQAVAALCEPRFGDRATRIAYELAQGSDNDTLAADRALARVARLEPGSAEAVAGRSAYLSTYGSRSVSWSIDHPTAAERPDLVDAQIELLRTHGSARAAAATDAASTRREALAAEVEATLTGVDERATFRRRLARLASFVPVREARARWQLVASGAMRHAVLRHGDLLVRRGVLVDPLDVLLLEPEEYDAPPEDVRGAIDDRRAAHRHWTSITPPTVIGGDGTAAGSLPGDHAPVATDGVLRGAPGAPGVAEGTARVILELDDADRLEPGDVLVTTMTSPSWTPLFGVAAAVVTDAGDALSHVAIAAREYGIPCVAGTALATVRLRDGARVVVDGDAGTVRPEPGR